MLQRQSVCQTVYLWRRACHIAAQPLPSYECGSMERGRRVGDSGGSAWLFWVLALASAACSGNSTGTASGDSTTSATGTPATHSTTAATVVGSGDPSTS